MLIREDFIVAVIFNMLRLFKDVEDTLENRGKLAAELLEKERGSMFDEGLARRMAELSLEFWSKNKSR